jgi:hypothetical protein
MIDKKDPKDKQPQNERRGQSWTTFESILPGGIRPQNLVPNPVAKGDIFFTGPNANFNRVGIGTTGQVLQVVGGVPTWGSAPLSGLATNRPVSGRFVGDMYINTDTPSLSVWIGASWKSSTLS